MKASRHYRFWILSLMFLTLLASCSKGCGTKSPSPENDVLLNFIPADKNIVLGIDLKRIRESKWGATLQKNMPPQAQNLTKDLNRLVLGFNVDLNQPNPSPDFVAILDGKIDQAAWLTQMALKQPAGEAEKTEDYQGIPIHFRSVGGNEIGVAFLKDQAFFGKKESLFRAIDLAQKKGNSIRDNKAVMSVLDNLNQSKMIWAGGLIPEGTFPAGGLPGGPLNPLNTLAHVTALDLGIDFPQELTVDLNLTAKSAEFAQQISGALNFSKSGASMFQRNPATSKIWSNLNISSQDNRVLINLKLEEATLQEISNSALAPQGTSPQAPIPPASPEPSTP